jgi:hypothetical protein
MGAPSLIKDSFTAMLYLHVPKRADMGSLVLNFTERSITHDAKFRFVMWRGMAALVSHASRFSWILSIGYVNVLYFQTMAKIEHPESAWSVHNQ